MDEKILTPDQVAQILQVHPFTVLKFIKQGKLRASKLGRVYRIRESDVNRFLDDQEAATASKSKATPHKEAEKQTGLDQNQLRLTNESALGQVQEPKFSKPSQGSPKKEVQIQEPKGPKEPNLLESEEQIPEPKKESFVQSVSKKKAEHQTPNQSKTDEMDHYILD